MFPNSTLEPDGALIVLATTSVATVKVPTANLLELVIASCFPLSPVVRVARSVWRLVTFTCPRPPSAIVFCFAAKNASWLDSAASVAVMASAVSSARSSSALCASCAALAALDCASLASFA